MNDGHALKRALVVEDYEPFRRFLCSMLRERVDIQVIWEESDGVEAVKKAQELEPDLVILDLGLPGLNGIEVVQQIRLISPRSKILMLTAEWSPEIVEEAFRRGANGYLVKSLAGREFEIAVNTILRDTRFFCDRCCQHGLNAAIVD